MQLQLKLLRAIKENFNVVLLYKTKQKNVANTWRTIFQNDSVFYHGEDECYLVGGGQINE